MATTLEAAAVATGQGLQHSALKLSERAVRDALAVAAIGADDVDLLLNAGLFHDRMMGEPALAALIQQDVGANAEDPHGTGHGTFSFDVANGSAGVLTALQIADGFLRAGTIHHAVIVAGDADPGHQMAPGFPYDPVGAALVCGWDPGASGLVDFRWTTAPDAPARRRAVVGFEHGRNRLRVTEDESFGAEAATYAGTVAVALLNEYELRPGDISSVVAAPFADGFIDELVPHLAVAPERFVRPDPKARFHTAGLIAALADALSQPAASSGEWVLLVAAGAGISAGAALLQR